MNEDIPVISSDNYQGGRIATEKLISADCQYIVHTNGPVSYTHLCESWLTQPLSKNNNDKLSPEKRTRFSFFFN